MEITRYAFLYILEAYGGVKSQDFEVSIVFPNPASRPLT